ncbi:MAG: hypothetical protein ACO3P9_04605 [Phycisphaerales bacterium]|jgi:hypothetical protein
MTWARRSLRSGSLRSVVALATFAAVAVACDRSAEVGSAPDASEFVDTSMRIDGDRLTLRHGVGPRLVGDAIPLLVIAEPSDGAVATIELPDDGRLGPFEFAIRPAPRLRNLPIGSEVVSLELWTFESGTLELPPIEATFERGGDGVVRTVASAPLPVVVEGVLGEEGGATLDPLAAMRPPKGVTPMQSERPGHAAIWWLSSVALTGAVLVGGFLLLSRRRGPAEPPPAVWARRRIADLRTPDASRTPSDQWAEVASLLRGLLARRDGLDTLDRTTGEIRSVLVADDRFSPEERDEILQLLEQADLAKFAGGSDRDPGPALDVIERLVESGESRAKARLLEAAA